MTTSPINEESDAFENGSSLDEGSRNSYDEVSSIYFCF